MSESRGVAIGGGGRLRWPGAATAVHNGWLCVTAAVAAVQTAWLPVTGGTHCDLALIAWNLDERRELTALFGRR